MKDIKENNKILKKIIILLEDFLKNKISGKEFEKNYIDLWRMIRDGNIVFSTKIHNILDKLFTDVDCFVFDKKLLIGLREENKDITYKEFNRIHYGKKKMKFYAKESLEKIKKIFKLK